MLAGSSITLTTQPFMMGGLVSCMQSMSTRRRERQLEHHMQLIAEAMESVQLGLQGQQEQKQQMEQQIDANRKAKQRALEVFARKQRTKEETVREIQQLKLVDMTHARGIERCQQLILHYTNREQQLKQFAVGIVGQQRINLAFKKLAPLGYKTDRIQREADDANSMMDNLNEFSHTHADEASVQDPISQIDLNQLNSDIMKELEGIEMVEADQLSLGMMDVPLAKRNANKGKQMTGMAMQKKQQQHTLLDAADRLRSEQSEEEDDDDDDAGGVSVKVTNPFSNTS